MFHLKCHKFVIRFGRPSVYFYRVLKRNHQELDAFVFDDLEVHSTLKVADVDPAVATLHLLLIGGERLILKLRTLETNVKFLKLYSIINVKKNSKLKFLHRIDRRCAKSSTSTTTSSKRERDSFCRIW